MNLYCLFINRLPARLLSIVMAFWVSVLFVGVLRVDALGVGQTVPKTILVKPNQSIQSAIQTALPGDTIILDDGVYYQQIRVDKSLVVKAKNGGKATLAGTFPGNLSFSPVSGTSGLYSVSVNWPVKWAMYGDRSLLDYGSLQKLKEFRLLAKRVKNEHPEGYPVPYEGFAWENGKLYVRLLKETDPNTVDLTINRASDADVGITIAAHNVTIDGLRIHLWHQSGITVKEGIENTAVRNCFFDGCFRGVFAADGDTPRRNLLVEYNEFSGKPFYDLRRIDFSYAMWQTLYDANLAVRFLRSDMHGVIARHNYVYQVFDGIECKGGNGPTELVSDFSYNALQMVVDNSFELDTDTKFMNARIHHNFLLDGYTYLSFAPFQAGELLVDHNIFYTSPDKGLSANRWLKNCIHEFADRTIPQRNMTIVNNTVVLGDAQGQSSELYTPCAEGSDKGYDFQNSRIENNIFWLKKSRPYALRGFTFSNSNLVYGSTYQAGHTPDATYAAPGFVSNSPKMDFHLKADSPAVKRGSMRKSGLADASPASADLGAIPQGSTWHFPTPGPSWANPSNMPQRPSMPASLDASWMGLQAAAVPKSTFKVGQLLFEETFENGRSISNWISEIQKPDSSSVAVKNGKLNIDVQGGATVWYKPLLTGNIQIEYDVTVVKQGGANDRVSDLNQFWMASDEQKDSPLGRKGNFSEYDNLRLYYASIGGNNNTTTRFRKYLGTSEKPLAYDYTDKLHLLEPNKTYAIKITVFNGNVRFVVNNNTYFEYADTSPYPSGYFAFRTLSNHMLIDNFRVHKLVQNH